MNVKDFIDCGKPMDFSKLSALSVNLGKIDSATSSLLLSGVSSKFMEMPKFEPPVGAKAAMDLFQSKLTFYSGLQSELVKTFAKLNVTNLNNISVGVKGAFNAYKCINSILPKSATEIAITNISNTLSKMIDINPDFAITIVDKLGKADFERIQLASDDSEVEVNCVLVTKEEAQDEIEQCSSEILSLKDSNKIQEYFKAHPLIFHIVVTIIWSTIIQPSISNIATNTFEEIWENNKYDICSFLELDYKTGIVKVEKAYIRENNDSHSQAICKVLYGDELEILDSLPYWYKVRYENTNGEILEGYISKISIDY